MLLYSITLEYISVDDRQSFWESLGFALSWKKVQPKTPIVITNARTFCDNFKQIQWDRPVVLFFDEFDKVHKDEARDVCSEFLEVLRAIRNDKKTFALH